MTHAGYIFAAFGLTGIIVAGIIMALMNDYRTLRRDLAQFGDKGPETDA